MAKKGRPKLYKTDKEKRDAQRKRWREYYYKNRDNIIEKMKYRQFAKRG